MAKILGFNTSKLLVKVKKKLFKKFFGWFFMWLYTPNTVVSAETLDVISFKDITPEKTSSTYRVYSIPQDKPFTDRYVFISVAYKMLSVSGASWQ